MALQLETIPLAGGLDEASGKTNPRAGRLLGCENFEVAFGVPGYRRIAGYERFDGRAAPSVATYYTLPFKTGTAAIAAGETVTGVSGSGIVVLVELVSGTWVGGNAQGNLILVSVTGTFALDDAIQVSAVTRAAAAAALTPESVSDTNYATKIVAARDYYRNLITKPTGYGPIRGVAIFSDVAYCLRDDDDTGVTATLWRSSISGWTSVRAGLRGGGTLRTANASFNGTGGDLALYGVDGKNRAWSYTGSTFTFAPIIYSTDGTSSSNVTPGTGDKTFTTESGRGWTTAHTLRVYSRTDASSYMVGVVKSYSSTTLVVTVAADFDGAAAADWHICREDGVDRPYIVTAHKNHLFLAYPRGQLQHSDLGAPFTFGATSGVLGFGDELVDLTTLRSDVLAVFQDGRISMLYGAGKSSWELKQHSRSSNTRSQSAQEIGGNAVFLNDAGILSLVGSDTFGDFDAANIAADAIKTLRSVMTDYKATALVKTDSQYRIYGANKLVLVMAWAGNSPTPNSTAYTRLRYLHQPVCAASDNMSGDEVVLFGTDDGWVMRERTGTTFDGEPIMAFIRTSYWHSKSPDRKKRYRKLTLDCDAVEQVTVRFKLDYDFAGLEAASSIEFSAIPSGGFYDTDNWNEFFWSNPEVAQLETNIEGVARFMSMVLWAEGDFEGFSVYGASLQYSPLEIKR